MNAGINGCKESIDVMEIKKFEIEIRRIEELYKNMNESGEINNIQEIQNLLEQINALQSNADLFLDSLKLAGGSDTVGTHPFYMTNFDTEFILYGD